jgi:nucleoside-diphosphate-sugar epimerase
MSDRTSEPASASASPSASASASAITSARITNARIFITGGAGFIGTRLAQLLAGENEIILFDNLHRNAYQSSGLARADGGGGGTVRLVQGDVRDAAALRAALDPDIDYVIHAAAIAGVETVIADPLRVLDVNVRGTFNVAEAAVGLKRLKKFVDFSTSEVFGQHAFNVDERTISPTVAVEEPRWAYAMSKLIGEFVVHAHHARHGMPTVTVRPFNIYGPNQVGIGAVHRFVKQAIAGQDLIIHDDGSQIRSWCYVDDFIEGVLRATASERATGRSYNLGNPRATVTVYDLAQRIVRLTGGGSRVVFERMNYPDVALRVPNITAAREDLGFEPRVDLDEGLRRTIAWYRTAAQLERG